MDLVLERFSRSKNLKKQDRPQQDQPQQELRVGSLELGVWHWFPEIPVPPV
jgi:hypothetical protein